MNKYKVDQVKYLRRTRIASVHRTVLPLSVADMMEFNWSFTLLGLYWVSVRTEPMEDLMTVSMSSIAKVVSPSIFVQRVEEMAITITMRGGKERRACLVSRRQQSLSGGLTV